MPSPRVEIRRQHDSWPFRYGVYLYGGDGVQPSGYETWDKYEPVVFLRSARTAARKMLASTGKFSPTTTIETIRA